MFPIGPLRTAVLIVTPARLTVPLMSIAYCTTTLWSLRATTTHKITTSEPQKDHPFEGSSALSALDFSASLFRGRGFSFGVAGAEQIVNVPSAISARVVASVEDIPPQVFMGRLLPASVTTRLFAVLFRTQVNPSAELLWSAWVECLKTKLAMGRLYLISRLWGVREYHTAF